VVLRKSAPKRKLTEGEGHFKKKRDKRKKQDHGTKKTITRKKNKRTEVGRDFYSREMQKGSSGFWESGEGKREGRVPYEGRTKPKKKGGGKARATQRGSQNGHFRGSTDNGTVQKDIMKEKGNHKRTQ